MSEHGKFYPAGEEDNDEVAFLQAKLDVVRVMMEELQRRRGSTQGDLLHHLGIPKTVINDPENPEHQKLVQTLRRTAGLIHPDAHSQEDPLVQKTLTFAVMPVTEALNTLRKPRKVSG